MMVLFQFCNGFLRLALAKALGKRCPFGNDGSFFQLLTPFALDATWTRFNIGVVPVLLCRFGHFLRSEQWNRVEERLRGVCFQCNDESQSSTTGTTKTEGNDSMDSMDSQDPNISDSQTGHCELAIPANLFDPNDLNIKQILKKCVVVDPGYFQQLSLNEQLYHIAVRDVAIEKLRQELVQAGCQVGGPTDQLTLSHCNIVVCFTFC